MEDLYKTLSAPAPEVLFKEKSSKFFGYAFPVTNEEEIGQRLEELRKTHHSARHCCYAWQIGTEQPRYRANDDGEPHHTAGMPIFGQIQSFGVTNVLIVVVRYFGGIKLGTGGLISAYKQTACMALQKADIIEKAIEKKLTLIVTYQNLSRVMRIIRAKNLTVLSQQMESSCKLILSIKKSEWENVFEMFNSTSGSSVSIAE